MTRNAICLRVAVLAVALLCVGCSQAPQGSPSGPGTEEPTSPTGTTTGTSVAGTYECAPEPRPDDPNWPGPETFELREDGTLTVSGAAGPGPEGTWTQEPGQVVLHLEGQDDPFNIEGDRLIATAAAPDGSVFTCVKQPG